MVTVVVETAAVTAAVATVEERAVATAAAGRVVVRVVEREAGARVGVMAGVALVAVMVVEGRAVEMAAVG